MNQPVQLPLDSPPGDLTIDISPIKGHTDEDHDFIAELTFSAGKSFSH